MQSKVLVAVCFFCMLVYSPNEARSQQVPDNADTFFLAKKKGLFGKLGKMISGSSPEIQPVKVENQFLKFKGKIIRYIDLVRVGFDHNIYDTGVIKKSLGNSIAKLFHRNSSEHTIERNLFFREGDKVYPNLLAENERYLRSLVFLQDARILMDYADNSRDSVDVVVLTKDIFSIGIKLAIDDINRGRVELKDENFAGSGSRVQVSTYYEKQREPQHGVGAEIVRRNISGKFVDWTTGFLDYSPAFNSGRHEETSIYTRIERPLITPFIPATWSIAAAYFKTSNDYLPDSLYKSDYRYRYYNIDAWLGYSLDSKRLLYANKEISIHRFIALRLFTQRYFDQPLKNKNFFDFRFTDFTGGLASFNIFRKTFYKTNFIYGFGRGEDVPVGFSLAFTGGYINKLDNRRPYAGIDAGFSKFDKKGFFSNFTMRLGGFFNRKHFEDVNMLFNMEHFTRLYKLNKTWFSRIFINTGIAAQVNPNLDAPLYLNSVYGLPYYNSGLSGSDLRTTIRSELVFYNTHKTLGFRLAPFIFSDLCLLKPSRSNLDKSDLYYAFGGGVRTRNENLVFGTIELKLYCIPRTAGDMTSFKIDLSSNIRFAYKSTYISRPDVITDIQ